MGTLSFSLSFKIQIIIPFLRFTLHTANILLIARENLLTKCITVKKSTTEK